jgi:DNA-binding NarL/FixJ family response regulator
MSHAPQCFYKYMKAKWAVTALGEASDGEEALSVALRERPDIVVTDLVMPPARRDRTDEAHQAGTAADEVILMSSYTEDAYRMMASDSGADTFVSKQVLFDNLIPAIYMYETILVVDD